MFAGKHGFITPRDLFRWADRGAVGYEQLAENGFAVLGERLRQPVERETVSAVLEKTLNVNVSFHRSLSPTLCWIHLIFGRALNKDHYC